jgi:hypothetical protein
MMAAGHATAEQLIFVGSSGAGHDGWTLLEAIPLREGVIGSDRGCDFCFQDPFMAAQHGRFFRVGDRWALTQLGIAPVFVDGHAPAPGQGLLLEPGSFLEIADTCLLVGGGAPRLEVPLADARALEVLSATLADDDPLRVHLERPVHLYPEEWVDDLAADLLMVTRDGAFVLEATMRSVETTSPPELRRRVRSFLAHPACAAIERLTVATETSWGDPVENGLMVLQGIAAARPPRLRSISLGVVVIDGERLANDFSALRSILPIATTLPELTRAPQQPSIVILEADGWGPRHPTERIPLSPGLLLLESGLLRPSIGDADVGDAVRFVDRGDGRWTAQFADGPQRQLRTGDELRLPGLLFRFEI